MRTEKFEKFFLLGLISLGVLLSCFIFWPELNVIVLAATMAILFHPLYARLRDKMGKHTSIAALLTIFVAAAIVFGVGAGLVVQVFHEAQGVYGRLTTSDSSSISLFVENNVAGLRRINAAATSVNVNLKQYIEQVLTYVIGEAGSLISEFSSLAWTFFLAFFGFYYLLKDGPRLRAAIEKNTPFPADRTKELVDKIMAMFTAIIRGSILMAICYGVLVGIGFFLFGIPNPALWGTVAVILSFIPVIGVWIVAVPAAIFLALSGKIFFAVALLVYIGAMGIFMENFLRPYVVGHGTKIHPFLLLLSIIGALGVFGPIGILLGPIILGFLLVLLQEFPHVLSPEE